MNEIDVMSAEQLETRVRALEERRVGDADALSMVVFSGELDRLLAAFVIATGAAASGMRVSMFFTFWGTAALKRVGPQMKSKSWVERALGWMLPGGFHKRRLSRLDMGGLGRWMMTREMRRKRVPDLASFVSMAQELDVELRVCEMSMSLMGIKKEELIEYPGMSFCGVASFLETSSGANTTLFI